MLLSTPCFSYLSWSPPQPTTCMQTSVLINSTLTVQVQEEFTTGECKCTHINTYTYIYHAYIHSFFIHAVDPRLLDIHVGLIIAGAIFWMLAVITVIISSILLKVAKYPSSCKYLMATISTLYLKLIITHTDSHFWLYLSMVTLIAVAVIFVIVALILWIGVGLYTGIQQSKLQGTGFYFKHYLWL